MRRNFVSWSSGKLDLLIIMYWKEYKNIFNTCTECKKCISINIKENKGHQIKRYEKKTMISIVNKNQFNLS